MKKVTKTATAGICERRRAAGGAQKHVWGWTTAKKHLLLKWQRRHGTSKRKAESRLGCRSPLSGRPSPRCGTALLRRPIGSLPPHPSPKQCSQPELGERGSIGYVKIGHSVDLKVAKKPRDLPKGKEMLLTQNNRGKNGNNTKTTKKKKPFFLSCLSLTNPSGAQLEFCVFPVWVSVPWFLSVKSK